MRDAASDTIPISAPPIRLRAPDARRQTRIRGAGLLACLDSLAAVVAILAVLISLNLPNMSGGVESFLSARISVKNVLLLIFLGTAWPALFHVFRLYDARRLRHRGSELSRLVAATTVGSGLALVFPLTSVSGTLSVGDVRHFWLAALALCLMVRIGRRAVDRARYRQVRRALIVGAGRLARRASRDIRGQRSPRYEVVGFVDGPHHQAGRAQSEREPLETIGTLEELEQILMREVIDEVLIALPVKSCYQQIQQAIRVCERAGVPSKYRRRSVRKHGGVTAL